jgi:hypothetical protein
LPNSDPPNQEISDLKIVQEDIGHLSIVRFENSKNTHILVSDIFKDRLVKGLECFGPFEVNNVNPSVIVNANSDEVLLFKYNHQISQVKEEDMPKLSE